jgi:hypothetical protein
MILINKKIFVAALVVLGMSPHSFALEMRETLKEAGAFIEPAVTYETSSSRINTPVGGSSGEVAGYGVALRAGAHASESIFVGVDGRYSFPQVSDGRTGLDGDAEAWNWGPILGVQMPIVGLRLWGSYVANGEIDPDRGLVADIKFKDGEGYRVGAGFKVYNVSVNLEYQNIDYGTSVIEQGSSFLPSAQTTSANYENESYLASVSFPMAF